MILIIELNSAIISNLIFEKKLPISVENEEKKLAIADTDKELLDSFYHLSQLIEKN